MDGFDVARAVRADSRLDDVLLVALTGYAAGSDKSRALAAGFDYHLTKPLSLDKLRYILANRTGGKPGGIVQVQTPGRADRAGDRCPYPVDLLFLPVAICADLALCGILCMQRVPRGDPSQGTACVMSHPEEHRLL